MYVLRLAVHASVVSAAELAGGLNTRAAEAVATLVIRDVNVFDLAEMNAITADYAINKFTYPNLGAHYQATDNAIRKYWDFRWFR
jgi:hypothetical protein